MPHNSISRLTEADNAESVHKPIGKHYKKTSRSKQAQREKRGIEFNAPLDHRHQTSFNDPNIASVSHNRSHSQRLVADASVQLSTSKCPSSMDAYYNEDLFRENPSLQTGSSASPRKSFPVYEREARTASLLMLKQSHNHIQSTMSSAVPPLPSGNNSPLLAGNYNKTPALGTLQPLPSVSVPYTPPPLLQTFGSDIERIHQQYIAERATRLQEIKFQRPEYLERSAHSSGITSEATIAPMNITRNQEVENPSSELSVMDSPVKGRRIVLFQETSEESFEQSLLAGGYPLNYGDRARLGEPSSPEKMHPDQHQRSSPSYTPVHKHYAEITSSDINLAKSHRLAAFRDSTQSISLQSKLFAVEIEGLGRVLQDRQPQEAVHLSEIPARRRGNLRKKAGNSAPKKAAREASKYIEETDMVGEEKRPNWLDTAFPWSMRTQERLEQIQHEESEKLRRIQWYLERESSSEDEDNQSLGLPPMSDDTNEDQVAPSIQTQQHKLGKRRRCDSIPIDWADARAALLSKRLIHTLADRGRLGNSEDEDSSDETTCICKGTQSGKELVQCDDCHRWYHLECIGVASAELGREEDPWHCSRCIETVFLREPSPQLVQNVDDLSPSNKQDRDLLFFQRTLNEESPPGAGFSWGASRGAGPGINPQTPTPRQRQLVDEVFSSRSSRDSQENSSSNGPRTPSTSTTQRIQAPPLRVWYSTPPSVVGFEAAVDEPFDPSSTPSRGLSAAVKLSGMFTTPQAGNYLGAGAGIWLRDRGRYERNAGSLKAELPLYTYDESPVRRVETMKGGKQMLNSGSPINIRRPESPSRRIDRRV